MLVWRVLGKQSIFVLDDEDNGEKKDDEVLRVEKNVLIDVIYKMMKYVLFLFFFVVCINVFYVLIVEFIVEVERIENIFEVLQIIKLLNQFWDLKYFMFDYFQ